jgi:hypothetical protein
MSIGRPALQQPFAASPSWFLRITRDRCGKDCMLNAAHMPERQRGMVFLARMRHDGCGGRPGRVEWTSVDGLSSQPVR